MPKKKQQNNEAAPTETVEEVEFPVESHIPIQEPEVATATIEKPFDRTVVEHKVIHNDQGGFDEILVGYSEPRYLADEPLPDIRQLLGQEIIVSEIHTEPKRYQTMVNNSTMGVNLVIHPAIAAGICELCGTTRFVDKKDGTKGEVWKLVNRKTLEHRFSYRRGDRLPISAADCPHYRNVDIRCSYCQEGFTGNRDRKGSFIEVIASRILYVFSEPGRPNQLIMVCSDFRCKSKFDTEYHINQTL